MQPYDFVGRKKPLKQLDMLTHKRHASLVVIRGRRRVGKSRLIYEFAKNHHNYNFSGLPPTPTTTAQSQREAFAKQLASYFQIPIPNANDWLGLFSLLAKLLPQDRRIIVVFDEITWMGNKDPDFLGQLKTAWDQYFNHFSQLMIILCGSVSGWIEKNILANSGFVGRISLDLILKELRLAACNDFLAKLNPHLSSYDKLKILAITGGIPKYLEEIIPSLSVEENIKRLCFESSGFLFNEFDKIFHDLFSRRSKTYTELLRAITNGSIDLNTIIDNTSLEKSGLVSDYLYDLELAGFITRDYTWLINSGKISKLSKFRLSDNYIRFYLRYIEQYKEKIHYETIELSSLSALPAWQSIMGLQVENLVLNNRRAIHQALNIAPNEIIMANPYFQRATKNQAGCQIDYMIQTQYNTLYLCEIKFSKTPLNSTIINEVKQKIQRLKRPKYFSVRPVLLHVNGINDNVKNTCYFANTIDITDFLKSDIDE